MCGRFLGKPKREHLPRWNRWNLRKILFDYDSLVHGSARGAQSSAAVGRVVSSGVVTMLKRYDIVNEVDGTGIPGLSFRL